MADADNTDVLQETTAEAARSLFARPHIAFDIFPRQSEYATLIVGGLRFQDWTNIWLKHDLQDQYAAFKFTCADMVNIPERPYWERLQFDTGEECEIYLGRVKAMRGVIITRQTAYDAISKGIILTGYSFSWWAMTSSILDKSNRFEGGLLDIAAKVLAPTGIGFKTIGDVPNIPFKPAATPQVGEHIGSFLERLARDRNVLVAGLPDGNVVFIGNHEGQVGAHLTEGVNILKLQCIHSDETKYRTLVTIGQTGANDDQNGREAAEQEATATGSAKRYRALLTPMEHPVWTKAEVVLRNNHEVMFSEGGDIMANITVQGWFTPAGFLWQAGDSVLVRSPMARLEHNLVIQSVTFTQDRNQGSLTELACVSPWALKQKPAILLAGDEPPPEGSQVDTGPAETPPKAEE